MKKQIIKSNVAPSRNDLWLSEEGLKEFKNNEWQLVFKHKEDTRVDELLKEIKALKTKVTNLEKQISKYKD